MYIKYDLKLLSTYIINENKLKDSNYVITIAKFFRYSTNYVGKNFRINLYLLYNHYPYFNIYMYNQIQIIYKKI